MLCCPGSHTSCRASFLFFNASFNELGSIWPLCREFVFCMTSHHLHSSFSFAFVNNVCLLKTEQNPLLDRTLETNPIIFKCCDCYHLISFHNCSPNSSFHIKIHLVKPFLEASVILIKLDSVQARREPSHTRSKMTNLQSMSSPYAPPKLKLYNKDNCH